MKNKTTVTEEKLAANRRNAKRSTGPRSERGKNNSRFNAVKTGLFAEHVVIPACDGDPYEDFADAEEQFAGLLEALQQEHNPQGPSEVFWVAQMAECIWKQRRVSRSESGMVRATREMNSSEGKKRTVEQLLYGISVLKKALTEIETTRSLSPATYEDALSYVDLTRTGVFKIRRLEAKNEGVPTKVKLNDKFVASLEQAKAKMERVVCDGFIENKRADYYAARAVPWDDDMNQILRYDKALQKKFDWALQNLRESQERRRKAEERLAARVPERTVTLDAAADRSQLRSVGDK